MRMTNREEPKPFRATRERLQIAWVGLLIWLGVAAVTWFWLGLPYVSAALVGGAVVWFLLPDPS
jgi:hypothetical protein